MFSFGKKKLDDGMLGNIAIELAMFMRWSESTCHRMLSPPQAMDIAKRILDRENLKYGQKELVAISALAMGSDFARVDEFRKKTGFDRTITGFCASIGIDVPSQNTPNRAPNKAGSDSPSVLPSHVATLPASKPPGLPPVVNHAQASINTQPVAVSVRCKACGTERTVSPSAEGFQCTGCKQYNQVGGVVGSMSHGTASVKSRTLTDLREATVCAVIGCNAPIPAGRIVCSKHG